MIFLYLITPILGSFRNYIKYKKLKFLLFIRTPVTYFMINLLFQCNNIWKTLIYERWFFFIYKSILSFFIQQRLYKKKRNILRNMV